MDSSPVSESRDKSTPTTDFHEEDGDDIKEEVQDLTRCQSPFIYIPDDLCPTENDMPSMTKRLSMAWDLLKDIPGSIFTSFIQDLFKKRPKEEIRDIIVKLNSHVSDERCEAAPTENEQEELPTNKTPKLPKKLNRTTKKPRTNKTRRELTAIKKDQEYWRNVSHSFNSETHSQRRRSSRNSSVQSYVELRDEDEVTSEDDATSAEGVPTVATGNKKICEITTVKTLSGEKDSNVQSSCLQSLQKSSSEQDRSRPSKERKQEVQKVIDLEEQYLRLLHEYAEVLNSQDENDQDTTPSLSSVKRKLPETETQILAKRSSVESVESSPISALNRLESKISELKKRLSDKKSHYAKYTSLKCKFCPKSDYSFKSAKGLQNHLLRHYKLRPMQCTRCKMTLHNGEGFLQKHEKTRHGGRKCFFTKTELPSGPPVCIDIPIPIQKRRKARRYYDFQ